MDNIKFKERQLRQLTKIKIKECIPVYVIIKAFLTALLEQELSCNKYHLSYFCFFTLETWADQYYCYQFFLALLFYSICGRVIL